MKYLAVNQIHEQRQVLDADDLLFFEYMRSAKVEPHMMRANDSHACFYCNAFSLSITVPLYKDSPSKSVLKVVPKNKDRMPIGVFNADDLKKAYSKLSKFGDYTPFSILKSHGNDTVKIQVVEVHKVVAEKIVKSDTPVPDFGIRLDTKYVLSLFNLMDGKVNLYRGHSHIPEGSLLCEPQNNDGIYMVMGVRHE